MTAQSFPFTLTQLVYFAEVGRLENMTAAAETLRITQPTLSASIRQLEASLGARLFLRNQHRRIRLTPAGRTLLEDVESLLGTATEVSERAQDLGQDVTGELVVGVYSPIAPHTVPNIFREFSERFPEVSLRFVDGNLASLQRNLLDGSCDIAILYRLGLDPEIRVTTLDRVSPYVLLPEQHPLAAQPGAIRLEDLAAEPLILLDLPHAHEHYLGLFERAGITPSIRYRSDSYETVRSFVGSGLGYTILHQGQGFAHTYSGGTVVSKPLEGHPPSLEIVLGESREIGGTRRGKAFALIAQSVCASAQL